MTLRLVASLTAVLFLSACASLPEPKTCALIGAGVGAGAGTAGAVKYADHHEDGRAVGIGIGSLIGGALIGYATCALFKEEPAEAPVRPAPPPPPPPPPAEPDPCSGVIRLRGVEFEFDSATLTPVRSVVLEAAVESLQQFPRVAVGIQWHTDSVGPDAYNMSLGQRRADSVKSFFVGKGLSGSRLTTKSFGESQPIATNDTAEGRALNRRVELHPAQ